MIFKKIHKASHLSFFLRGEDNHTQLKFLKKLYACLFLLAEVKLVFNFIEYFFLEINHNICIVPESWKELNKFYDVSYCYFHSGCSVDEYGIE